MASSEKTLTDVQPECKDPHQRPCGMCFPCLHGKQSDPLRDALERIAMLTPQRTGNSYEYVGFKALEIAQEVLDG